MFSFKLLLLFVVIEKRKIIKAQAIYSYLELLDHLSMHTFFMINSMIESLSIHEPSNVCYMK